MFRGDDILCGTSTTGTGALSLAAPPEPPGGVDPDTWARAIGFGNSASFPISYTIEEYTDTTWTKVKGRGKGKGVLNLGASAGIANCTLTRTNEEYSITGMDGASPAFSIGSTYSIGTAANTLVFVGDSAFDQIPAPIDTPVIGQGGIGLVGNFWSSSLGNGAYNPSTIYYSIIQIKRAIKAAVARALVSATYSGGTSNLYVALYAMDPANSGLPGKLIQDFGALGTAGSAFASSGVIASATVGSPKLILPGYYWRAHQLIYSGGSGTPGIRCTGSPDTADFLGQNGSGSSLTNYCLTASGGTAAFSDPAAAPTGSLIGNSTAQVPFIGIWSS